MSKSLSCVLLLQLAVMSGCGSNVREIPNLVPVSGTITYRGEPLKHGDVRFGPVESTAGHSAVGKITAGRFTMVTTASASGVVIGEYHVRVDCREPQPAGVTGLATSLIPEKYSSVETSGLQVTVTKGMKPLALQLED
jgi:hypothetical protein